MFTGIVEVVGEVIVAEKQGTNLNLCVKSSISPELKVDQSVAHNGVCLTVTKVEDDNHWVTAVDETLQKTNLSNLKKGAIVNLERCLKMGDRLDGHMVYGHVDAVGECLAIEDQDGSKLYTFSYPLTESKLLVEKGSLTVNGTSLTIFNIKDGQLNIAVIPYTFEHTVFKTLKVGDKVNLEFDVLGKYIQNMLPPLK